VITFTVGGRVVATSRARTQRTIERILDRLAALYVGRTVEVHYPADYSPRVRQA